MRVLIFSHVRLFCETLSASLESWGDIYEVGTCSLADTLVEDVARFRPDIVLFHSASELSLGEVRAVSNAFPGTLILALAVPENPEQVIACADAGVTGYIPPQASVTDLHAMLQLAFKGECVCSRKIVGSLLREVRRRQSAGDLPESDPLTQREVEVLSLIGRGFSNKEIARELVLSIATVKHHVHNIFGKLRVSCRAQALTRLRNEPWLVGLGKEVARG
jgi:DNA-binding NarL/FixJ family response regulator